MFQLQCSSDMTRCSNSACSTECSVFRSRLITKLQQGCRAAGTTRSMYEAWHGRNGRVSFSLVGCICADSASSYFSLLSSTKSTSLVRMKPKLSDKYFIFHHRTEQGLHSPVECVLGICGQHSRRFQPQNERAHESNEKQSYPIDHLPLRRHEERERGATPTNFCYNFQHGPARLCTPPTSSQPPVLKEYKPRRCDVATCEYSSVERWIRSTLHNRPLISFT